MPRLYYINYRNEKTKVAALSNLYKKQTKNAEKIKFWKKIGHVVIPAIVFVFSLIYFSYGFFWYFNGVYILDD